MPSSGDQVVINGDSGSDGHSISAGGQMQEDSMGEVNQCRFAFVGNELDGVSSELHTSKGEAWLWVDEPTKASTPLARSDSSWVIYRSQ